MGKRALIVGSTGLVGNELLHVLLEEKEYDQVVAIVRSPLQLNHTKLTQRVVDFDQLQDTAAYFAVDDVFCCLGTTIKKAQSKEAMYKVDVEYPLTIARMAKDKGAQQYLLISSMGANPHSSVWYSRMKGNLEQELRKLNYQSISILRPSLLLGNRKEFRLGERFSGVILKVASPLFVGPLRKYRAIQAKSVALAMYRAAQMSTSGVTVYSSDQLASIASKEY
ncbi:oxidoreductase [Paenibacillus segetis]|uniref:Oxidoreductase n=1 Tax=Paenibacillus segetis TaxID=1325360 RepID=A0ABQ1YSS2_9BACL|nr:oxidoreductase [Paenibacillus segetis]GGH37104.1 oxidoreductase [Paenibacillus segetis]